MNIPTGPLRGWVTILISINSAPAPQKITAGTPSQMRVSNSLLSYYSGKFAERGCIELRGHFIASLPHYTLGASK
jgi:hypothetical protein